MFFFAKRRFTESKKSGLKLFSFKISFKISWLRFMDKKLAEELLIKVKNDYNLIAEEYSASRPSSWGELNIFSGLIKDGDRVLDLGCGNGRLLKLFENKTINYLGADNSEGLLEIAKNLYPDRRFLLADALDLPIVEESFEIIFSIAALHHIPSEELRLKFLSEANRVLKQNGKLVLTVWKLDSWGRKKFSLLLYGFLKLIGVSKLDFGDLMVPWANKTKRYYHYFNEKELKKLAEKSGFRIKECGELKGIAGYKGFSRANIYLVAEKI